MTSELPTLTPTYSPTQAPIVINVTNTTASPTAPEIQGFNANTEEFMTQLQISIPVAFVIILIYCALRRIFPLTFELRRKLSQNLLSNNNDENDKLQSSITFPNLSPHLFVWIYQVWAMDSNTFYHHAGFDALVFRLYLKGCAYICFASLPYALLVLLPVYGTSELINDLSDPIDKISLNTVGDGSPRLYAAVLGSYIFTFIALYYLSKVYLAVAYATDQFLIGAQQLEDIDNISWLNYRHAIDHIIDFSINGAKFPMGIYRKGKKTLFSNKKAIEVRYYGYSTTMPSSPTLKSFGALTTLRSKPKMQNDSASAFELDEMTRNEADGALIEDENEEEEDSGNSNSSRNRNSDGMDDDEGDDLSDDEMDELIPPIDRYTVMIRDLPRQFREKDALYNFMNDLFPGKIAHVTIVPDVHRLKQIDAQIKREEKKLVALSKKHHFSMDDDLYRDDQLPVIMQRTKCCGLCGPKVNAIGYHRERRDALITKFNEKKEKIKPTPTAFVIFNSLVEASNCVSSPIRFGLSTLKVSKAPYPKDLYWGNLKFKMS